MSLLLFVLCSFVVIVGLWILGRRLQIQRNKRRARLLARRRSILLARRRRQQQRAQLKRQRALQGNQRQQQSMSARRLHLALLQVTRSPDFRRAASVAATCRSLPVAYRKRMFDRHRALLARHLRARLDRGGDSDALMDSLRELLSYLAVPDYEADYLMEEVRSKRAERPGGTERQDYGEQLRKKQEEHRKRLADIEANTPEGDLRDQLLEQEKHRFEEELLGRPTSSSDDLVL